MINHDIVMEFIQNDEEVRAKLREKLLQVIDEIDLDSLSAALHNSLTVDMEDFSIYNQDNIAEAFSKKLRDALGSVKIIIER